MASDRSRRNSRRRASRSSGVRSLRRPRRRLRLGGFRPRSRPHGRLRRHGSGRRHWWTVAAPVVGRVFRRPYHLRNLIFGRWLCTGWHCSQRRARRLAEAVVVHGFQQSAGAYLVGDRLVGDAAPSVASTSATGRRTGPLRTRRRARRPGGRGRQSTCGVWWRVRGAPGPRRSPCAARIAPNVNSSSSSGALDRQQVDHPRGDGGAPELRECRRTRIAIGTCCRGRLVARGGEFGGREREQPIGQLVETVRRAHVTSLPEPDRRGRRLTSVLSAGVVAAGTDAPRRVVEAHNADGEGRVRAAAMIVVGLALSGIVAGCSSGYGGSASSSVADGAKAAPAAPPERLSGGAAAVPAPRTAPTTAPQLPATDVQRSIIYNGTMTVRVTDVNVAAVGRRLGDRLRRLRRR